ncbi:hypothetical protein QJQ45_030408 [Haematococcus lacustris]|nr:hypothetical protein QJQ45_030408 [Haematococcus lacustris]
MVWQDNAAVWPPNPRAALLDIVSPLSSWSGALTHSPMRTIRSAEADAAAFAVASLAATACRHVVEAALAAEAAAATETVPSLAATACRHVVEAALAAEAAAATETVARLAATACRHVVEAALAAEAAAATETVARLAATACRHVVEAALAAEAAAATETVASLAATACRHAVEAAWAAEAAAAFETVANLVDAAFQRVMAAAVATEAEAATFSRAVAVLVSRPHVIIVQAPAHSSPCCLTMQAVMASIAEHGVVGSAARLAVSATGVLLSKSLASMMQLVVPRMMQSTARLTTGAAPSLQHKGISDTISSQAKRTPSQKPHAGNAPAANVGVVTSSSQPAEQPPRRSLAELETMLSRAMNQISMERDPASRQGDDGPFDISELWAAGGTALSQGSHSESYQESHLDTVGTAESRRTRDMDEVLSGRVGTVGGPADYPALHPVNAWRQASPQQQQPYSKQHASRASPPPASQRQAKPSAKQAGRKPDPAVAVTTHERSNVVAGSHASAAAAARPQSAVAARGEPPHMVSRTASPHWQRPPSPSPAPHPAAAGAPRQYAGAGRARPLSAPRMHSHRQAVPAGQASPRAASRPQQATAAEAAQRQGPPVGTECTFQPRINPASRDMVAVSYPADWEQRVLQLSVPKPVLMARYEEVRKEAREEELRECTFAPRTGRAPSPAVVQRSGPVHERLYNTRPAWEEKRGELLREREEAVLADCTFKPAVTSVAKRRAASAGRVPLHLRVADVLRSKNENMSNARIRREMADEGITFRPAVNPRSAQMVAAKQADAGCSQQGMPAGDRLYHEALHRSRAKDTERRGSDQACTFAPTINDRSRTLLARSGELPSSFLERQQFLASLAAEKKALYKSVVQEAEGTYTPRLAGGQPGAGPDGLRSSGYCTPKALGSSWASEDLDDTRDRLAKLAYADVRRSVALKDALTQHYYGQFPFTPDINPTSRVIGKRHTMEELYRDESARAARERAAEELAARQQEECTFQPALNPRSLQVAQHAAVRRSRGGSGSLLDGVNSQKLTQVG